MNECVGVKLSKTLPKSLSAFVLTVIAGHAMAAVVGSTAVATALSFIPGIGSVGASAIRAGANYAVLFLERGMKFCSNCGKKIKPKMFKYAK